MKRIGIFGGTFDPIHLGHLAAAQASLEDLRLEKVIFVPAGRPPHKCRRRLTGSGHRLAMVRLAIRGNRGFHLSPAEADSRQTSFTANTLKTIGDELGRCRLHLLIGMDQALQLDSWKHPEQIFSLAEVDVLTRPGYRADGIPRHWRDMVKLVAVPGLDISSSFVRRMAGAGRSIRYLVPGPVADYVRARGLYRRPRPQAGRTDGRQG